MLCKPYQLLMNIYKISQCCFAKNKESYSLPQVRNKYIQSYRLPQNISMYNLTGYQPQTRLRITPYFTCKFFYLEKLI